MRKILSVVLLLGALVGVAVARAADHPDSKTQPVTDGCNRSQLALLGEAAANLVSVDRPTVFPSWVYVNGDNGPKTLEGTVRGTHTAGTDLFGVHETYDTNIDVEPDPGYEGLLSSRNAEESPPQIHTEWESGLIPMWAWPSAGDRVRETGSWIWDCGHWQAGSRKYPNSDNLPGDPLAVIGEEEIGGESAEIHPIQELATWRRQSSIAAASQLDVYLSNQGGKAKAVMECALSSPTHEVEAASRIAAGQGCSRLQTIAGRDYTYRLDAPGPRPSADSVLQAQVVPRVSHHGPAAAVAEVVDDHVEVTVPFSGVAVSKELQDFGVTVLASWSTGAAPVRTFQVSMNQLQVFNNLDGDIGQDAANPSVDAPGEWNMFLDVAGKWRNVHESVPGLRKVPNASGRLAGSVLDVSGFAPMFVTVPADGDFHVFVDARECDLPGYTDCPADELDFGQFPGRADLVRPVSTLAGSTTVFVLHPPVCHNNGCPEDQSDASQCPGGCWQMTYTVQDVTGSLIGVGIGSHTVVGDGTGLGTLVDGVVGRTLPSWRDPVTHYGPDQDEEHVVVEAAVRRVQHAA